MSSVSDDVRRTRSGKQIERADSPHGPLLETTSPKRKTRAGKGKIGAPQLNAPLSILTENMEVPVRDMEAWVNRSVQERLAETKKRNGYVTRPMNSFMLYRSAYAERTKVWCAANNHQVVSSVSGASWPLEPKEVRDFYNELANIERFNHANAHPNYKFSPAKPGDRKRKGAAIEPDDASNAGDDADADWAASHRVRTRQRMERNTSYSPRDAAIADVPPEATLASHSHPYGREAWSHDMHALSSPIDHSLIPTPSHYYPSALLGLPHEGHDPYRQLGPPEYLQSSGFVGLPGASHHELLQLHKGAHEHARQVMEAPIDPILMPYDSQLPANLANMSSVNLQPAMEIAYGDYEIHYAPTPAPYADSEAAGDAYHHTRQDIKYDPTDWRSQPSGTGLDDVAHFDPYWPEGPDSAVMDRQEGLSSTYDEHSELHPTNSVPEAQGQSALEDHGSALAPDGGDSVPPSEHDGEALPAPTGCIPADILRLESAVDTSSNLDIKQPPGSEGSDKSPKTR
jgi:hypothetical protein